VDDQHIQLSEGMTCCRREGSLDGTPIVLVHGATVPSWEFDFLVPPLLRAGFQTLRLDLYGHGKSDRPHGAYIFERFERQVIELIEHIDFPRPAIFLGHSFGAALVAAVSVARPDWVSKIALVAPMLDFSSTTAWTRLFRIPAVGEIAMHGFGVPALIRRRKRRYSQFGHPQLTPLFIEQVSIAGYGRALLSMFRTGALGDKADRYSALRGIGRDILVITGDQDVIIPPAHIARVRALLPPHKHCAIPAEHNLLLTHPELVVDALVQWSR
jgi:pimeloyl-ACP methyl ester carboxylesterase